MITELQESVRCAFWRAVSSRLIKGKNCTAGAGALSQATDIPKSTVSDALSVLRNSGHIPFAPPSSTQIPEAWRGLIPAEYGGELLSKPEELPGEPLGDSEQLPAFIPPKITPTDVGFPSPDNGDLERENADLREELDQLKAILAYATHSDMTTLQGGTMSYHTSDYHFHNKGHLLNCFASIVDKTCDAIKRFAPRQFRGSVGGDVVQGRGIFKQQELENVLGKSEQQVAAAAWRFLEFDQRVAEALNGAPRSWVVIQGNHDYSMGDSTCMQFVYACRQLGVPMRFVGPRWVLNIADTGTHNVFVQHGYGSNQASPSPAALIKETLKTLLDLSHRGYVGEKEIKRVWHGHCFDEETEILTPYGWQRHDQLTRDSVVMTYNRDTGHLEWNSVQGVVRYDDYKELIHVRGTYGIDLAVTNDHGLWVGIDTHKKGISWRESTAEKEFASPRRVFQCAAPHDEHKLPLTDGQIKLIAWCMSEGNFERNRRAKGKVGMIRISQSDLPDGRLQRLYNDLTEAGVEYTSHKRYNKGSRCFDGKYVRNGDAYRITIRNPSEVWDEWLSLYMTAEKMPTRLLSSMSLKQMKVFLDVYVFADGSKCSSGVNGYQIVCKDKEIIDWLQSLVTRCGYRSSLKLKNTGKYYTLSYCHRDTNSVKAHHWSKEPYSGTVWCVTVPNGTLVVRRNGRPCITLNCHWRSSDVEQAPDVPFDVAGGLHRNDRVNIGQNQRPLGWWMFVSPPGTHEILQPIPIIPKRSARIKDMDDPELEERNRQDAARCLIAISEHLRTQGITGSLEAEKANE